MLQKHCSLKGKIVTNQEALIQAVKRLHKRSEKKAKSETDELFVAAGRLIKEIKENGADAADLEDEHFILENRLRAKRLDVEPKPPSHQYRLRR